jgi:hypothetical protein
MKDGCFQLSLVYREPGCRGGQLLRDRATTIPGTVGGFVRSIETGYDDLGRVKKLRS